MHEVATARRLRFVKFSQEFLVIVVLLASPVLIFVRPNDGIGLTAPDDVSHFFTCRPHAEVAMRQCHLLLLVTLTPSSMHCSRRSGPHCFLAVSVQCLLRGDSNCVLLWRRFPEDPSRNVLFSGARLLISDCTWLPLRCDPPSAV